MALAWLFLVADTPRSSRFCSKTESDYIEAISDRGTAPVGIVPWAPRVLLDRLLRVGHVAFLHSTASILLSPNLLGCAVAYGVMAGITYGIMTWVPTFLIQAKHYPLSQTGLVAATPWIGAIMGNLLGGYLSDRVFERRRKPLMMITSGSSIVTMIALIYAPQDAFMLSELLTCAGILLNLGYWTYLVYPLALVAKERLSFASAVLIIIGSLGGAMVPYLIGVMLDAFSWDGAFTARRASP